MTSRLQGGVYTLLTIRKNEVHYNQQLLLQTVLWTFVFHDCDCIRTVLQSIVAQ